MRQPVKEARPLFDRDLPEDAYAPTLREPIIQTCTLVTGAKVMLWGGVIRTMLWTDLPETGDAFEARIIGRFAMPLHIGRDLAVQLQTVLPTSGH